MWIVILVSTQAIYGPFASGDDAMAWCGRHFPESQQRYCMVTKPIDPKTISPSLLK